jgi:THO complex subunit 2
MELRGLFQYLVNQLKKGNGIELVLLQELIQQMANVQYTENMTEEQLDSMAGGDTLRYQATSFGVTRNNKALIKSTNRLRDSLLPKDEPKLAIPLLLLIAQHRSVVVINTDSPYIKMVSEQFDRCHGTLLQYVEFLSSAMGSTSAYAQMIPYLHDLIHLYHLDPEVAFLIYRPVMRLFRCQNSDIFWPLDCDEFSSTTTTEKESEPADPFGKLVLDLGSSRKPIMWSDLLETVSTMLPSKAWNSLSPDLYATFWGLGLYDLYVPRKRYESEITKQHSALRALEELSDNSNSAITKRKKDKERIQESLDRLTVELQKHEENVASVRRRLAREKDKWLSSCPDTLKINMEFLQRCIFPRCTFSMPDAVYCAMFVHTLHSLGTPFFNTVNHIDVLICKTLQPMICCCTEYEVGRLGRFLYETLKTAYYWKSDESIYERECGNMPGFAVYYRYPNSQRVTYSQFIKVHWKWSQRITRLLIQCLESSEYMEIRNALILLTKISNVFPVTRKSGINLEKRVAKIKSDEREDLKVLATGVAAALASRKPSWVTEEEFGMGYLELKAAPSLASKPIPGNIAASQNGSSLNNETALGRVPTAQLADSVKDPPLRTKHVDERTESASHKSDTGSFKQKSVSAINGSDFPPNVSSASGQSGLSKAVDNLKQIDESVNRTSEDSSTKVGRTYAESESRGVVKRSAPAGSFPKQPKQEDGKSGKAVSRTSGNGSIVPSLAKSSTPSTRSSDIYNNEPKPDNTESSDVQRQPSRPDSSARSSDKLPKRASPVEELDRLSKRRKGEIDSRDLESDVRVSDRERPIEADDKPMDSRSKDKGSERHERDHRESRERLDKSRGDDILAEKSRDRSMERYGRERSVEKTKDERNKQRYNDDKSHGDERAHGQSLPPPPPLPPHVVPQSVNPGRREEDGDRRFGSGRHNNQRLSPRHDDRERRRSEESLVSQDDSKRRREEEFRDRKRDERDVLSSIKAEERERERSGVLKEEMDANAAASKRRKVKRDQHMSSEAGEYSPPPPVLTINLSQSYDARERKAPLSQRPNYLEDPPLRINAKDAPNKMTRRDSDSMYDREWDDEKRQRPEQKRRHRKQ